MRLLLVEDSLRLAELVASGLDQAGFVVDTFGTVADAEGALAIARYEAIVLDLGLPDGDGLDVVRRLRRHGNATPVLILTARDGIGARVEGLDCGADDYLVKPFATDELVARLRALLRRPGEDLGAELRYGDISFDPVAHETRVAGRVLSLARRETDLLEQLLRAAGRVVQKTALDLNLYGAEMPANTIEAVVSRLRKRLAAAGSATSVVTVRGLGYFLSGART